MKTAVIVLVTTVIVFLLTFVITRSAYRKEKFGITSTSYSNTKSDISVYSPSKTYQWCYDPGYVWSIPRISMPSCLGILPQYQVEWWFYVGYVIDTDNNHYTIDLSMININLIKSILQVVLYSVGLGNNNIFMSKETYGINSSSTNKNVALYIPPVTDSNYEIICKPQFSKDAANITLADGIVGLPNAKYNIKFQGDNYSFNLDIQDIFGGRLEGKNGYIGGIKEHDIFQDENSSYEWCCPVNIVTGGTLNFNGQQNKIKEGWVWFDRQVVTYKDENKLNISLQDIKNNPNVIGKLKEFSLYTGNWFACIIPNTNIAFYLACGWPVNHEKGKQWIVGSELGIPKLWNFGAIYYDYYAGPGEDLMDLFDINILNPNNVTNSPHWTSPTSNITYCTGWKVSFKKRIKGIPFKNLYFVYFRPDCEIVNHISKGVMEGAAKVYTDIHSANQVGWGWVEQMGLN